MENQIMGIGKRGTNIRNAGRKNRNGKV